MSTKPKKAPSAYVLFCNAERDKLKTAEPTLSFGDVGRRLGEMWGKLTPEQKQDFDRSAADARLKYDTDMAEWKKAHPDSDEEKGGKKRGKKAQKPTRAPSAFLLFSKEKRPELKASDPSLSFGELGKRIGVLWHALDESAQKVYTDKANAEKAKLQGKPASESKKKARADPEDEDDGDDGDDDDDDDDDE